MATDDAIMHKLDELLTALRAPPGRLWDAATIAGYLSVSVDTARRYAARPDFPAPIRLPSGPRGTPRWKSSEVQVWAEKHRLRTGSPRAA